MVKWQLTLHTSDSMKSFNFELFESAVGNESVLITSHEQVKFNFIANIVVTFTSLQYDIHVRVQLVSHNHLHDISNKRNQCIESTAMLTMSWKRSVNVQNTSMIEFYIFFNILEKSLWEFEDGCRVRS